MAWTWAPLLFGFEAWLAAFAWGPNGSMRSTASISRSLSVLERRREIGTCKAIRASDGDIPTLFVAEARLIGLLGGVGGIAPGRVVSWLIEMGVNAYARSRGVLEPIVAFAYPWELLLDAVTFAVVASVVSGVYPASRAAGIDPVASLRGD